jgi:hypothetical protein
MSESSQRLPTYCDTFPCTHALSTPFSHFSAYSCTCALTCFCALMHFVSDRIQPHIRVFSMPSCITRWIPACACLACLSSAYQLVPTLAHLRVFHALMHFAPDRTQTTYHDSHISLLGAFLHNATRSRARALSMPFSRTSACSHARAFARFHALMCFRTLTHFCA